jgi:hypothetical protein
MYPFSFGFLSDYSTMGLEIPKSSLRSCFRSRRSSQPNGCHWLNPFRIFFRLFLRAILRISFLSAFGVLRMYSVLSCIFWIIAIRILLAVFTIFMFQVGRGSSRLYLFTPDGLIPPTGALQELTGMLCVDVRRSPVVPSKQSVGSISTFRFRHLWSWHSSPSAAFSLTASHDVTQAMCIMFFKHRSTGHGIIVTHTG